MRLVSCRVLGVGNLELYPYGVKLLHASRSYIFCTRQPVNHQAVRGFNWHLNHVSTRLAYLQGLAEHLGTRCWVHEADSSSLLISAVHSNLALRESKSQGYGIEEWEQLYISGFNLPRPRGRLTIVQLHFVGKNTFCPPSWQTSPASLIIMSLLLQTRRRQKIRVHHHQTLQPPKKRKKSRIGL